MGPNGNADIVQFNYGSRLNDWIISTLKSKVCTEGAQNRRRIMQVKLSKEFKECFAWWPMYTNVGKGSGTVVWLEFVYRRWNTYAGRIETITVDDHESFMQEGV
ncbi:hypothetical protein LCGC14_1637150 [marine sediment metagenome]|uniref:Uncharacterized protein n=1 Tax=marine sediment metagenome TaxID=412755 RepID=A0A0F9I0T1_9ZZZZ